MMCDQKTEIMQILREILQQNALCFSTSLYATRIMAHGDSIEAATLCADRLRILRGGSFERAKCGSLILRSNLSTRMLYHAGPRVSATADYRLFEAEVLYMFVFGWVYQLEADALRGRTRVRNRDKWPMRIYIIHVLLDRRRPRCEM